MDINKKALVKVYWVTTLCLLTINFSWAQNSTDSVTEKDYYAFFNSTENPFPVTRMGGGCNPDSVKVSNLNSYPETNALHDDTTEIFLDTLFSSADKASIRKQMKRIRNFRWKNGELSNVNVIDGDKVKHVFDSLGGDGAWEAYYKIYKIGYNQFSVPLFSCNKLRCIVYRGFQCSAVYGLGNTNVFEKRGDKWAIIKSCSPWVH